jgi:hypothetical protein
VIDGAEDHRVLLNQGEAVDLVVVGEGVVVVGDETEHLGATEFAEGLEPHVAVEEHIAAAGAFLGMHDERLDHADLADRGEHGAVFAPRVVGGFDLTNRMDRRERQRDAVEVEGRVDGLHVVWRARSARNLGMVSSFSARRRLM